jgi:hypothetical protein
MRLVDSSAWIEWLIDSPIGRRLAPELPQRDQCLVPTIVQLELSKWLTRVDAVDGVQLKVRKAGRRGAIAVLLALRSTMPSVDPLSHGPAFPPPASSRLRSPRDSG